MAAKKKPAKPPKPKRIAPPLNGYVRETFRWQDVLKAMPPDKKPGASNEIPSPLEKP
jgi:hypothetical protein